MLEKNFGKMIAQNIRLMLSEKRMNFADLARKMGRTRSATSDSLKKLEQGSATIKTICKYADALEVDPSILFQKLELKPKGEWLWIT